MDADLGRLRSRSQNYALLAQIIESGFDPSIVPILRLSPLYGPVLEGLSALELAQQHERTFGFDLSPLAGAYLDPRGCVGGPLSERLSQNLIAIGAMPRASFEPESLAEQLALLARLVGGEVEGRENERPEEWQGFQLAQGLVLHQHLLPWLPPLAVALSLQSAPVYQVLGSELWSCAQSHLLELDPRCDGYQAEKGSGQDARRLLQAPETGLKQIASFLIRPLDSGWYLSRSDLASIAEASAASLTPGSRQQMMEDLLQGVEVTALTDALEAKLAAWTSAYGDLGSSETIAPWLRGLGETRRLVVGLKEAA